ncbi:serine integrase [Streptomyces phage phiScoe44]|nr:serine integrase [Streptomyces phage phiScoe44]
MAGKRKAEHGKRLIAYVRVSKVGDRGEDLKSPEMQLAECQRYARSNGMEIVEVIQDLDLSGRTSEKRQVGAIIEKVRKGEADGVVVWKYSRWGRDTEDVLSKIRALRKVGGFIRSATEGEHDIDTSGGKLSMGTMVLIAQYQSDQIGDTWRNIHDLRRSRGLPHTGGPRFGYIYDAEAKDPSKVYTVDPVTGPWLAKAYRMFASGRAGAAICTELWENGVRSVHGRRIVYRSLMGTLDSGMGAGLLVDRRGAHDRSGNPNGWDFYPGAHEAVISEDVWKAYLARRAEARPPREKAAVHRLTGLLACGSCRRRMRIMWRMANGNSPKHRAFVCQLRGAKAVTTQTCPGAASISQHLVEEAVLDWLKRNHEDDGAVSTAQQRHQRANKAKGDLASLDKEIATLTRRREAAMDDALDEGDAEMRKLLRKKVTELNGAIKDLEVGREVLVAAADSSDIPTKEAFAVLMELWEYGDMAVTNEALRQVIERIEVHPGARVSKGRVKIIAKWDDEAGLPVPSITSKSQPVPA